jgi:predicted  nucleic acid-binding Zn ribbon protein
VGLIATAELTFSGARSELEDRLSSYLASLHKHGHTWGDAIWTWTEVGLTIVCMVPLEDSLEAGSAHEAVARDLRRLESSLGRPMKWHFSGKPAVSRRTAPEWLQAAAFCLQTDQFDRTSPLVAADSREPVPLYLLPLSETERESCVFWMGAYQAHDRIWLDSRDLESAAYYQLASPDSELSRRGHAICGTVERSTGVPTYYFLFRYHVPDPRSNPDLCSVCKQPWARPPPGQPFAGYLVCDGCRLVSEDGVDTSRPPEPNPDTTDGDAE